MPKEIFIHEWKIQDFAGRREKTMMSEKTINGQHVYACKNLTVWFRLGKYLIKHDTANYLLGLTGMMSRHECQDNVKWWDWNKETNTGRNANCVDEIVKYVNMFYSGDEYVNTLLDLQEKLVGYEKCLYISQCYRLRFDYRQFLNDRDAYQKRLEDFVQAEHEREMKEKYPVYDATAPYRYGQIVRKDGRVYIFHNGHFILIPKEYEWPLELEALQRVIMEKITMEPDTDELFVTLENYGLIDKEV